MTVVGQSVVREDARSKATGTALFAADIKFPRMLHAAILRSPHPHAKIRSIDDSDARTLPGVVAILFAKDIPGKNVVHVVLDDQPLLAEDTVRYVGEPVGVVAAEDEHIARKALQLIRVDYKPLPSLTDFERAREKDAPQLYKDNNTFSHHRIRKGDVEQGFGLATHVVDAVYHTPYQEHAYLEPQGMVVNPLPNGTVEVHGTMQCPFYVQGAVAETLGLPLAKVRVIQAATGGAFGGKEDVPSLVAGQAALLAWHTQRPVRLIYRRDEDIICMSKRHPARIHTRVGCDSEGLLTAIEVEYIIDGGAYSTLSPIVLWRGTVHAAGPYRCPNVQVDSYAVCTNRVPNGAFRGFGSPQVLFAIESQIDELARKVGLDPLALREKNLLRPGDLTATGQKVSSSCGARETLVRVKDGCKWDQTRKKFRQDNGVIHRGLGVSSVFYGVGLGAGGTRLARTGAFLQITEDGSVQVAVGTTEMGQGMRTVLGQIAADGLGVSYDRVTMLDVDTSRVPDSGPTVASRATTMSGNAILDACAQARQVMSPVACEMLQCAAEDLIFENDSCHTKDASKGATFLELISECHNRRLPMAFQGYSVSPPTSWNPETGQGDAYVTYAYASNVVQVVVDTRTGQVTVEKVWAAHDIGKAVNPITAEGQIEGGAIQGLGFGLCEELLSEDGKLVNPNFTTYIIPTSVDSPEVEAYIHEHPYEKGPFGAKGFGEQPLMGMAPALANAISDAVGVRLWQIPATAERIWEALKKHDGGSAK